MCWKIVGASLNKQNSERLRSRTAIYDVFQILTKYGFKGVCAEHQYSEPIMSFKLDDLPLTLLPLIASKNLEAA